MNVLLIENMGVIPDPVSITIDQNDMKKMQDGWKKNVEKESPFKSKKICGVQ